jgi:hypothetical protein
VDAERTGFTWRSASDLCGLARLDSADGRSPLMRFQG